MACITATGIEIGVLQAEKVAHMEYVAMGDVALKQCHMWGVVSEEGVELVVSALRLLAGPGEVECGINVVCRGVGKRCAGHLGQAVHQMLPYSAVVKMATWSRAGMVARKWSVRERIAAKSVGKP